MSDTTAMEDGLPAGHVVSKEVATEEFLRMLDAMDLLDAEEDEELDDDELARFREHKRRLIRAIQKGSVVVNDKGEPTFTPRKGNQEPLTFRELKAKGLSSTDHGKKKKGDRTISLLAESCKVPPQRFEHMYSRDYKVCVAILSLFLG